LSELQKRIVTGVFGIGLLVALTLYGGFWGVWFLAVVISFGMVSEFVNICYELPDRAEKKLAINVAAFLLALAYGFYPVRAISIGVFSFLAIFAYFLFTARRHEGAAFQTHCRELMYSVFGLVYLAVLPLFLPAIRRDASGREWILLFLLIVWAGDTAAYFVGRKWGRHKLYAKVSPKKTVEGAVGGLLGSVIAAVLFQQSVFNYISLGAAVGIAAVVCAASQVGDLCESLVKRAFDKKDSGSILPGHGGFLDRFDSVVFSLPIMYACMRCLSL
jgi:phosphatidate cytidylyltransferase